MALDLLEYRVLSILRERMSYLRYAHILNENLFESHQTRYIYSLISGQHSSEKSDSISIRSLRILLTTSVKPGDLEKFRGIIRRIRRCSVDDPALVDGLVKRFAKRQLLKHAVLSAVESLDSGEETDLERVRQKIDQAISVDQKNIDESYDYFRDPFKRMDEESHEDRIATRISPELDRSIAGGLAAGEIGIIIAPTGMGKTLTLVNIGYGALLQGKKVVHATLEIRARKAARRYDLRISGASFKELKEDPGIVQKKLKVLTRMGAALQIKDYTSTLCSVSDLRAYLERLRSRKFIFDMIIVDHIDLMYSSKHYGEKRHELSAIVAGLRRLGSEFSVPVWTASQATREAGKSGKTRLWDIAEDIGKANWADLAITISQTEGEKEEGFAWLQIVKSRLDKGNPRIQVLIDYDTMTMEGSRKGVSERLRH